MSAKMRKLKPKAPFWPISLRLPAEFRSQVDRHLAGMKAASPGTAISHSDALRNLIALGLASVASR